MWPFSKKKTPAPQPAPAPTPAPQPVAPAAADPDGVHGPVLRALEPWLARNRRTAWRPVLDGAGAAQRVSQFGGAPWVRDGEPYPVCGKCGALADLFLQLDGRETPPGSPWTGPSVLQLFYCRVCDDYEPGSAAHVVRAVPAAELRPPWKGATAALPLRRITGWEPFTDTPHPEEQDALGVHLKYDFKTRRVAVECPEFGVRVEGLDMDAADDDGREIAEVISFAQQGDKLGGWPAWVQNVEYPACPRCQAEMRYLFQIDSDCGVDHMFGDSGCGHVSQCPAHPDVFAFTWACC